MLDYRHCTLCPRRCGVDRTAGQLGFCRMPDQIHAARAALHYWEEPVISGSYGSGAVFFSGCTLRCAFCQNGVISQENFGKPLSPAGLRAVFERLIDEGCQNINLVTPTHFLPSILPALTPKLPVPVVYNCGGYESVETLRQLEGLVDNCLSHAAARAEALRRAGLCRDGCRRHPGDVPPGGRRGDRGRADDARRHHPPSGPARLHR